MSGKDLLMIPVYLNQRAVFDLVAMLQGGISTVTRVSEMTADTASTNREIGAAFGLNKAFASLLRIDLSAKRREGTAEGSALTASEERVHTPASLFFFLRSLLLDKKDLLQDDPEVSLKPKDFFEFSVSLSRNPIVEVIDAMHQMMSMAAIFAPPNSGKQAKNQTSGDLKAQLKQIDQFRDALREGGTIDLVTKTLRSGHSAVITVETQYLNDPSMADLVDGTFTIMGKVVRVLSKGEGSISLLRNMPIGRLPTQLLEQTFEPLRKLSSEQGFRLPDPQWKIDGPVIQILPVAIYA